MGTDKPIGAKAYGTIPHLPGSRRGPGDHGVGIGQARIATAKARDRHDLVYVQEKLDGSCVAVAKVDGEIIALGRAGYRAVTSKYAMHVLFHDWVLANWERFDDLLNEGERAVGEWLAQAHGTRYDLADREPFVLFDIMRGHDRAPFAELAPRVAGASRPPFALPATTAGPMPPEEAMAWLGEYGRYGALDPAEGAVWRVERNGGVDFLCKWVRPDKVDGAYLDSVTGGEPVWNWRP